MDKIARPKTSPKKWICIKNAENERTNERGSYKLRGGGQVGDKKSFS